MSRGRTRLAVDSIRDRLDLAGVLGQAMRSFRPSLNAPRISHLDIPPEMEWGTRRLFVEWRQVGWGGLRPWWLCPWCGRRCRVLLKHRRALSCRVCLTVNGKAPIYESQRLDGEARAQRRVDKLERTLRTSDGEVSRKPPRMHWRTYWRLVSRIEDAELERFACSMGRPCAWLDRVAGIVRD